MGAHSGPEQFILVFWKIGLQERLPFAQLLNIALSCICGTRPF